MTVYRRLKRENINIDDLRDAGGKLTPQGAATIASLFDADGDNQQHDEQTSDTTDEQHANVAQAVELAVLRERIAALTDKLASLTDERDRLRQQVDTLTAMLQAEQQQRQRLLTDGGVDHQQRRGLFGWFKRDGKGQ
jgi:septal ring factor EnvC (AmiA/AmiB activator)